MITKNRIIFLIIFCILQLTFVLLYQKQDKIYFLEYEAFVKDSEFKKNRLYNDALNKVYIEIHKKINFKNSNTEVLGNITKKKMQDWDWDKNWFNKNIRLFFAINSPNKDMNHNLEKDLKNDLSVTLQTIKSEIENKIAKINAVKTIIISQELDQIDLIYNNFDDLIEINNYFTEKNKKELDKAYNEIFLNFEEKIELIQKQQKEKSILIKNLSKNDIEFNKTMSAIWGENWRGFDKKIDIDEVKNIENQIKAINKFNIWSKLTITKEIQFLQFQILLIDNIFVDQTEVGRKYKPIHLYLFSAIFFQLILYAVFDIFKKLIKKF